MGFPLGIDQKTGLMDSISTCVNLLGNLQLYHITNYLNIVYSYHNIILYIVYTYANIVYLDIVHLRNDA